MSAPHQQSSQPSRRAVLAGAGAATAVGLAAGGTAPTAASAATPSADGAYKVGAGIADVTGPVAENGMMGYSSLEQQATGLHMRLMARAFVVVDSAGGRLGWVVVDHGVISVAAHRGAVRRLAARHPGTWDVQNLMVTCTHTHASVGGCTHDVIYNLATYGFQEQAFEALVDGIVTAVERAQASLAAGSIHIGRTELHDASRNRSLAAFEANPAADRAHFPGGIDPTVLVLRFRQGTRDIGMLNWYPTHGTSLTNTNTLVSGDNKGYAAWSWERELLGQDPLDPRPRFVAAFAQSNSGDMTPNLALKPGTGPTDDEFENMRIIGARQRDAAHRAWEGATEVVTGPVGARTRYVDMDAVRIDARFTPEGKPARTAPAVLGESMLAGSTEDGPGPDIFKEGVHWPVKVPGETPDWVADVQYPKVGLVPVGLADAAPSRLAVTVARIGQLWIVGIPAEVTIVAGLRLRQQVAEAVGARLDDVVVQGYTNGYSQYVTTPQEYDTQEYEGGSTLFGRWTLCAYQQETSRLATALKTGATVDAGAAPVSNPAGMADFQTDVVFDSPHSGKPYGGVITEPKDTARGATVSAVFVTGHPKNGLLLGGTFLEVQRRTAAGWVTERVDTDFDTRYRWKRTNGALGYSTATIEWDVPADATAGEYRILHRGHHKNGWTGKIAAFQGITMPFRVS
ncbi:alkaline ceramidase [Kytococcus schroeteri]|uniref:Neutral ceramidase n=1 Tax=Kytococcus schroeteri TaxID=138300 RepID=A0A2I1PDV6_9MICO|nr:neutral/alkaline ceramidase [Kytococcus schroeteri]PKZ42818.1 alkaline ceramidase [Kytococcus schroeteri]